MEYVTTEPDLDGLGAMLADLIRANIQRDPPRALLLKDGTGTINVRAKDAGVAVGLEFAAGRLHVFAEPFRRAGLDIETDSGTLMDLSTVPLKFGQPDVRTAAGRAVVKKLLRRELRVKGLFAHPVLLGRLQRLLSTA
ncbi:MAG: hypothetical protein ACRDJM_06705 [Actinomycetota bacterium]